MKTILFCTELDILKTVMTRAAGWFTQCVACEHEGTERLVSQSLLCFCLSVREQKWVRESCVISLISFFFFLCRKTLLCDLCVLLCLNNSSAFSVLCLSLYFFLGLEPYLPKQKSLNPMKLFRDPRDTVLTLLASAERFLSVKSRMALIH